ncbi:MAG: murein biosynthesis integral membrane protein MurJ [Gammaproteobacteria bacterium]|nr:murein biosynthesis integral membrane protein MurJ [Gammaproteobacteria bacterium]
MSLFRKFASVGGATVASRVLGFVREAMIASMLGAGPVADAFYAAFRFPNLFRRLFAEGAFNAAFVPLFAKQLEAGGEPAARGFAEQVLSVLVLTLLLLSALAMIFMPQLVATIVAPRFADTPDKFDLTVFLAQVMFPYLAAMSLVAMLSGILNAFRKYFLAALAPVLLNVSMIAALSLAALLEVATPRLGQALAFSVTLSGIAQLALLAYAVHRHGFGIRLARPRLTPAVRHMLWLALPAALTGGIVQINLLIGQIIASGQDGAIAIINYADRLLQLPLGVIGIAIGVVLLPELSRALAANDPREANQLQNRSLEFGIGLTLPASVGLALLPEAIVALVFERGAFDRETTLLTARTLLFFAAGLPAFVMVKIFTPAFYAHEDMRTPMWCSSAAVLVNVVGSLLLFPSLGVVGIAIATALSGWSNALLLGGRLARLELLQLETRTRWRLLLIVFASAMMGLVLWLAMQTYSPLMLDASLLTRIPVVLGTISVAALVYFALVIATGAIERQQLLRVLRRKRGGARGEATKVSDDRQVG